MPEKRQFEGIKSEYSFLEKAISDDGKKVFTFVATNESVDRMGDIVIADGVDVSNYKKNPVILPFHDNKQFPVGKAVNIRKEDGAVYVDVEFSDTPEGQKFEYLVDNGYMKAVSIGFIPKEIYDEKGWYGKTFDELEVDYPEVYKRCKNKLKKASRVFTKSELLEVSIVPVPANQDALLVMASKGLDTAYSLSPDEELIEIPLEEVKNAVRYSEHPKGMKADTESMWDKSKAVKSLRVWASKDGSGSKEQMVWSKYRKGFGWYDSNVIDNFSSYKYPHHRAEGSDFYVVWRGVVSAMVFLDRGDIPAEDRKSLYNHLAKHYKEDFNKEPPEYKEAPRTLKEAIKDYDDEHLEVYIREVLEVKSLKELIDSYDKEFSSLKDEIANLVKEVEDYKQKLAEKLGTEEKQEETSPSEKEAEIKDVSDEAETSVQEDKEDKFIVTDELLKFAQEILTKTLEEKLLEDR